MSDLDSLKVVAIEKQAMLRSSALLDMLAVQSDDDKTRPGDANDDWAADMRDVHDPRQAPPPRRAPARQAPACQAPAREDPAGESDEGEAPGEDDEPTFEYEFERDMAHGAQAEIRSWQEDEERGEHDAVEALASVGVRQVDDEDIFADMRAVEPPPPDLAPYDRYIRRDTGRYKQIVNAAGRVNGELQPMEASFVDTRPSASATALRIKADGAALGSGQSALLENYCRW